MTNITNNKENRKEYNVSEIMGRAWAIRRAAAEKFSCKVSEISMGECLRLSWAAAEGEYAEINASDTIKAWEAVPAEKQVNWLQRCVVRASRDVIGYSTEDHYHQFNEVTAWGLYGHSFDEFVNEAFCRLCDAFDRLPATNERRAAKGKRPITLNNCVYNAAKAAVMAIYNSDRKHGRVIGDPVIENDNGDTESYVETRIADGSAKTEISATLRADLERFIAGRDEADQHIIELLRERHTEREIAEKLPEHIKMSNVAIHYRIVKIRDALKKQGIA